MADISEREDANDRWRDILASFKTEKEAAQYVAARLREMADLAESDHFPHIISTYVPMPGEKLDQGIMFTVTVTLSHPWGG